MGESKMDGITVLYQEAIYKTICVNDSIMNILAILFIAMALGAVISAACLSVTGTITFSVLGVIIVFSLGFLDSYSAPTEELDHYEYKVTIEDSVSMKEFLSKYEIINQEGEIFTIVERENKNEVSK